MKWKYGIHMAFFLGSWLDVVTWVYELDADRRWIPGLIEAHPKRKKGSSGYPALLRRLHGLFFMSREQLDSCNRILFFSMIILQ